MNKEVKSILRFENYIVKEVTFSYNTEYIAGEPVEIKMDMDVEYRLDAEDSKMQVLFFMDLFKEEDKTKYPFSMSIEVIGEFSVSDTSEETIEKYKPNTVAILFPYVRALVSSYTANANVSPLILPPINVNQFLKVKNRMNK